ncbi:hypothetical protein AC578_4130 [Pseudocercospora eumusae]|uniref:Uncharacterized protein n=1 Tax=Pseudocercospora eumusae TaxID=321146 RepID=A0A139HF91_9PEZI|nr:hypothetical protein AC578_4130 [Pseudocercospora eumusae]
MTRIKLYLPGTEFDCGTVERYEGLIEEEWTIKHAGSRAQQWDVYQAIQDIYHPPRSCHIALRFASVLLHTLSIVTYSAISLLNDASMQLDDIVSYSGDEPRHRV